MTGLGEKMLSNRSNEEEIKNPVLGILVSICITLQGPEKVREYEDMGKFCYFSH